MHNRCFPREHWLAKYSALQMKGRWESKVNVWFRFMYSLKWNCAASLFPKRNYNVLSPNFHIPVSMSDLHQYSQDQSAYFAAAKLADWSWEYINRTQIHECRNWEQGPAVSFLGIHESDFRYSVCLMFAAFIHLQWSDLPDRNCPFPSRISTSSLRLLKYCPTISVEVSLVIPTPTPG